MTRNANALTMFDTRPFGANGEGPVAQAVDAVLAALGDALGLTDVAHVAAIRVLADAIDNDSRRPDVTAYTLARATAQLVGFLDALVARATPPAEAEPDGFDALVTRLSAPLSDAS